MYCPNCRTPGKANNRFCIECGSRLRPYVPDDFPTNTHIPDEDSGHPYVIDLPYGSSQYLPSPIQTGLSAQHQPSVFPLLEPFSQDYFVMTLTDFHRRVTEVNLQLVTTGIVWGGMAVIVGFIIASCMLLTLLVLLG